MSMIQHWLAHIRTDRVVAFPRDYGLYRRKLLTQKQYLTSCEHAHKNKLEMYTAVLSDYEINNQLITVLYYDIDVDHIDSLSYSLAHDFMIDRLSNLSYSLSYNKNIHDVVELIVQLEPVISVVRALYSGRRGVHLHVDLEPVRVVDLRRAAVYVAELLGIADMVDKQVLGDWKRVSRVPGSYHKLTGNMCVLLNAKTDTELSHLLSTLLAEKFAVKSQCYTVPMPSETREVVSVSGEPPPCISYIVGQLLSGQNITHAARLHLGAYLIRVGLNPVEAAALFRRVPDFNESTTLYQLQWIQKHDYKMYSCVKARQLGLCPLPLENCKYYPSPNRWF